MKMLMRLFVVAILVLAIVTLTAAEPAQRRPLARAVVATCRLLTWAADSAAGAFEATGTIVEGWLESSGPFPDDQATASEP